MHGRKMVMQGQSLNQRIVIAELCLSSLKKSCEGLFAPWSALCATVLGYSKRHVGIPPAKYTRWTMVLIASGHQTAMNFANQISGDRPIRR
jgi:hypothetical protein